MKWRIGICLIVVVVLSIPGFTFAAFYTGEWRYLGGTVLASLATWAAMQ